MPEQSGLLQKNIGAATQTIQSLSALAEPLQRAADLISQSLLAGHKLLTCGNGGSAADAAHFATELVVRFMGDRRHFAALALTESGSTLTAMGNDFTFEQIFARQVHAFGRPGDVLVAFSTSGNSRNILLALEAAAAVGMKSVVFLGKGGGFTRNKATVELLVPSQATTRVQEAHLLLYHTLCEMIEPLLVAAK